MEIRTCSKCKLEKENTLEFFTLLKFTQNGVYREYFSRRCRDCQNEYHRLKRQRPDVKKRQVQYVMKHQRKYKDDPVFKLKLRARERLREQIRRGKIKRGDCSICDKPNAHAHHEDYTKALDVIWFCRQHHDAYHQGDLTSHSP